MHCNKPLRGNGFIYSVKILAFDLHSRKPKSFVFMWLCSNFEAAGFTATCAWDALYIDNDAALIVYLMIPAPGWGHRHNGRGGAERGALGTHKGSLSGGLFPSFPTPCPFYLPPRRPSYPPPLHPSSPPSSSFPFPSPAPPALPLPPLPFLSSLTSCSNNLFICSLKKMAQSIKNSWKIRT